MSVERRASGGVRVAIRVPILSRGWHGPVSVAASASLGERQ
jgi:hypothetical protein